MEAIDFVQIGDVSVGHFRCDEIAANNVVDVKRQLLAMIEDGRTTIVLNFAKIRFLYSDVLEMLINVNQELKKHGGRLIICNLQKVIEEIFTTTRLDAFFEITPHEDAALERLGVPQSGEPSVAKD